MEAQAVYVIKASEREVFLYNADDTLVAVRGVDAQEDESGVAFCDAVDSMLRNHLVI